MSHPEFAGRDQNVEHEKQVDAAVDDQLKRTSNHAVIADVTATVIADAASPGVGYVQAEAVAVRTEVVALNARLAANVAATNEILDVLRDAGLIPTA